MGESYGGFAHIQHEQGTKKLGSNPLRARPRAQPMIVTVQQSRLGSTECALASVMGAHGQAMTQALDSPHLPTQRATITIRAEEAENSSDLVVFMLGASGCGSKHKRYVS